MWDVDVAAVSKGGVDLDFGVGDEGLCVGAGEVVGVRYDDVDVVPVAHQSCWRMGWAPLMPVRVAGARGCGG